MINPSDKNGDYSGRVFLDKGLDRYYLCVLTRDGEEQLISTSGRNLFQEEGDLDRILHFEDSLQQITRDYNPLRDSLLDARGRVYRKGEYMAIDLGGERVRIKLPQDFLKLYEDL